MSFHNFNALRAKFFVMSWVKSLCLERRKEFLGKYQHTTWRKCQIDRIIKNSWKLRGFFRIPQRNGFLSLFSFFQKVFSRRSCDNAKWACSNVRCKIVKAVLIFFLLRFLSLSHETFRCYGTLNFGNSLNVFYWHKTYFGEG